MEEQEIRCPSCGGVMELVHTGEKIGTALGGSIGGVAGWLAKGLGPRKAPRQALQSERCFPVLPSWWELPRAGCWGRWPVFHRQCHRQPCRASHRLAGHLPVPMPEL